MNYAILGRQTSLCRAELETVTVKFTHLDNQVSLFEPAAGFDFKTLGGSLAWGEKLTEISTSQPDVTGAISNAIIDHIQPGKNKLTFGISSYLPIKLLGRDQLRRIEISLKQTIRNSGRAVRFVSPKLGGRLSAAEVIYNKLTGQNGYEFVLMANQEKILLGKTIQVQDINAYAKRDRAKPCRAARVGMLPPKLAQIMINLARPAKNDLIFDPFCGSGVVLIEALLRDLAAVGSDLSPAMVACANQNLAWAQARLGAAANYQISQTDATKLDQVPASSVVVTETYLGEPLSQFPNQPQLQNNQRITAALCLGFLTRLAALAKPGYRAVVCLPFWHDGKKDYRLDIIDQIRALGYTISRFSTSAAEELLYRRPDQIVGRQILVLTRN